MHYLSRLTLEAFLDLVKDRYAVGVNALPTVLISHETLPAQPGVIVLPSGF
jgi:hypothetical protein